MKTIVKATADNAAIAAELIYATDPAVWDYLFAGNRDDVYQPTSRQKRVRASHT